MASAISNFQKFSHISKQFGDSFTTLSRNNVIFDKILNLSNCKPLTRTFWTWLNSITNKFDGERVKEVGPDRACAEWLLRCGAHVRWVKAERFLRDYNSLPPGNKKALKIEEINATDASVMSLGFPYLEGLEHLKKISFQNCGYLDDDSIVQLNRVKDTLEILEIGSCGNITDKAIFSLSDLKLLKTLILYDLPAVKDKSGCLSYLESSLPKCAVDFPDALKQDT